jgi:hypothetical protein
MASARGNSQTAVATNGGGDSSAVLEELLGTAEKAATNVQARTLQQTNIETEIRQTENQLKEAVDRHQQQMAESRLRVLNSTLNGLRQDGIKEGEDLATAVFGLNAYLEGLGKEYANLGQPNADDKTELERAEGGVRTLQAERDKVAAKTIVLFRTSKLAELDQRVQAAHSRVEQTKVEIQRRVRDRLRKADMSASLQAFQLRVQKVIVIMSDRQKTIEEQIRIVGSRKLEAFRIKEEAAKALELLSKKLEDKQAELREAEERLKTLENGTEEYAAADKAVSELKGGVEDLRGKHNTALVLHQSKERFAIELETHERAQQLLRDNFRSWITLLKSDTEERVVTFKSRLSAQQAMMDQDAAAQIDKMGAEIDRRNADFMATAGAVSDRMRMEMVEDQPRRIQQLEATRAAQAEAIAEIRTREQSMIEYFKDRYDIDPTKSSFFHYMDKDKADQSEQPA